MDFVKKIDNDTVLLEINNNLYDVQAIINATYKFTNKCYIHNKPISDAVIGVYFKAKENTIVSLEKIADEFCNELIDQQVRLNIEKECGSIRNEIVKKAFSPITK